MKKLFKIFSPLIAMLLLLTACSGEKTKVFEDKENGHHVEATLHYKGDTVNKLVTVNFIKNPGGDLNDHVKNMQSSLERDDKHITGYSKKAEARDDQIAVVTELNYETLDFEKYKEAFHLPNSDKLENKRNLSKAEKELTDIGYTTKK